MNIVERLRADHGEIEELLDRAVASRGLGAQPPDFQSASRRLQAHVDLEERVLYAALEKHEDVRNTVDLARKELAAVTALLAELEATREGAERQAVFVELRDAFQRHADEDEHDGVLALAETTLSEPELSRLGQELSRADDATGNRDSRRSANATPRDADSVAEEQLTDASRAAGTWDPTRGRRYGGGEFQGDNDELLPPQPPLLPGDRG